jgi:hypothetical protein
MKRLLLAILIFSASLPLGATQTLVVVDLSDRLLQPGVPEHDQALILAAFDRFHQRVKQQLYFKSTERFSVLIPPQHNVSLPYHQWEEALNLDLSMVAPAARARTCKAFATKLPALLKEVYQRANLGPHAKDYPGVDLWSFFNERVGKEMEPQQDHQILVLTDGYFDFESYQHVLKVANRSTSTAFLGQLRGQDWKKKAEQGQYGLLPLNNPLPNNRFHLQVFGVQPKTTDLREMDVLMWCWTDWGRINRWPQPEVYPLRTIQPAKHLKP